MVSSNSDLARADDQHPDVSVQGEIDLACAGAVRDALYAAIDACQSDRVFVDLSEVTFMDSTGIGLFVQARNRALGLGRIMVLVSMPARIYSLFEMTGLLSVFEFVE